MIDLIESMLVREEGEVLHAYEDHLGYITIGVGRLLDKRKGGGISKEESRYLLRNDLRWAIEAAEAYPWFEGLSPERKAVVVGMIFQMGAGNFSKFKGTIAAIAEGDYESASARMLDSLWARQTPGRATRMAAIMAGGEWPY